jgi:carbonic anhydrase
MDILRPGYARITGLPPDLQPQALEKEAVVVSLENLMTFPFIAAEVATGMLTLHGLWHDTGEGRLEQYDPANGGWGAV